MDTQREHLVAPGEHRERGLALWVGLALGFAGIIVTVGGIYEWNARKTGRPAPVAAAPAVDRLPGEDAELLQLRRELATAQREIELTRLREEQARQREREQRPSRCIDGIRFEQFGREWRNVGRC